MHTLINKKTQFSLPSKLMLFAMLLSLGIVVNAQIVGSEAFIQGTYVEVGLNDCGVYGSQGSAPAGYHPNSGTALGFVADSDLDGWATGSPIYCGDYFLPGSPEEGFAVQVGSNVWVNSSQGCWPSEIPGEVTGYDYTGGTYSMTWEGNISSEDLNITQHTTLPEDAVYFLTTVTLCNEGATDLTDVYYMRNVDPDNDVVYGGTFNTINTIISNPPEGCDAVSEAVGAAIGCYLAYGARDPNTRASYGCFSTGDGDPSDAYVGTGGGFCFPGYETDVGSSTNCDCAIQIIFYIPTIAAGECEEIKFVYILDLDHLDEALDYVGSYGITADGVNITADPVVETCAGATINFAIEGGDSYDWVWTPPTFLNTTVGANVTSTPFNDIVYYVAGYAECDTILDTIYVYADPVTGIANAGNDTIICPDGVINLQGSGGDTYLWQPPVYLTDPTDPNTEVTAPETDMYYYLIAYNALGCADTDVVYIDLLPEPDIDAGLDKLIIKGGFTQLIASGGVTYSWTPTEALSNPDIYNPIANPEDTTMYFLTGYDEFGCVGYDSVTVNVIDPVYLVTPNAFSPNGDDLNDYYIPVVIGPGLLEEYQIYNRWGELVYEWDGAARGWDGTYQGQPAEIGTYIVNMRAKDELLGKELAKTATVILMR